MISSLKSNKTYDTNKILFLLKIKFPTDLQIYSTSFMTDIFPFVLKTSNVLSVFKKDSKLDYSNYSPISLLSNI